MSRTTKPKPGPTPHSESQTTAMNGPLDEVLTLAEAAAYLRLPEQDILRLVREQDLPGRQVGTDWRFFKRAIQVWLSKPLSEAHQDQEGIWAFAGAWKDDPHAEEMIKEIWRKRGQPVPEG